MHPVKFWKSALDEINSHKPVFLAVMVNCKGSVPNTVGAKMIICSDGATLGTVAGGAAEFNLVEKAKHKIKTQDYTVELIHMNHHPEAKENASGMICSGSQTFALVPLLAQSKEVLEKIIGSLTQKQTGFFVLSQNGLEFDEINPSPKEKIVFENHEDSWIYQEPSGLKHHVYIVGGGHCSLALSKVLKTLDFEITVFDNRADLSTFIENHDADHKTVIDYDRVVDFIPEGDLSYVVIMTFGHKHDQFVLEKLIQKNYRYLGMMGSQAKVCEVYKNLQNNGVDGKLFDKVYAPIGLAIGSNTPEEIAVSIAAEIIKVKSNG